MPGEHAGAHILRRADEVHASGLVMGAYRFGMVLEWLFDSTTNQIFAATRLPLLVMH
ncbi:universal stress protein [Ollibium composti]|uniref:Universal stress protein n=1 Tax=Ollibium composti TaxID=2675109 RepID=A0ABY2Q9E0_9HYPH|nr:universal stress protein [Mesorhizobium composti]THF58166.1 universal stress protein [Mesorhizobium composti]